MGSKFLAGNTDLGDAAFFMSGSINSKDLTGGAVSVFGGDLTVSGNLHASDYIYHLSDTDTFFRFSAANTVNVTAGNKALVDGTSTAGVVINEGGDAVVDFRVESDNNQWMFFVDSNTNRIGIGKTGNSPATTVHIKDASPILRLQRNANGEDSTLDFAGEGGAIGAAIHAAGSNDLVFSTHDGSDQEEILRLGGHWGSDNRQVILLSGTAMGTGDMQPKEAADINFFVSGAMYSKNTAVKGTAVFGGDTVISGALYLDEIPASVPAVPDGTVALYGKDDSGVTKLYFRNESGETLVGGGGSGISWDGSTANGVATFKDADEATVEANFTFDGTNAKIAGAGNLQLRDAAIFINSPLDGVMNISADSKVLILSGGAGGDQDASAGSDVTFFVSGGLGTKGRNNPGTTLFGGDVACSGTLNITQLKAQMSVQTSDFTYNGSMGTTLLLSTGGGAVTGTLPAATNHVDAGGGKILIVKDTGGFAGNPGKGILIKPNGSDTIDRTAGVKILVNSGSLILACDGLDTWMIVGSA